MEIHRYYRNGKLVATVTAEEMETCDGIMMLPQYDIHEIEEDKEEKQHE